MLISSALSNHHRIVVLARVITTLIIIIFFLFEIVWFATFTTSQRYQSAERKGCEYVGPVDCFIHLSWLTRPISLPLFRLSPVRLICVSGTSIHVKIRRRPSSLVSNSSTPLLMYVDVCSRDPTYLEYLVHTRLFLAYGSGTKLWLNALVLGGV